MINVNHSLLNSFLSKYLHILGIKHINSEVPKVLAEKRRKKIDIIGYDIEKNIPVIIELKRNSDKGVINQLQSYIDLISNKHPTLFDDLMSCRSDSKVKLNYSYGVVGIVVSPMNPPNSVLDNVSNILWAQYILNDNLFQIVKRNVLSFSNYYSYNFSNRPKNRRVWRPSDFVDNIFPNLKKYSEKLDKIFLSISPTIYPRNYMKYGRDKYIAYYGTDTINNRAIYGFNTGRDKTDFYIEFHVAIVDQKKFFAHPSMIKLKKLGLFIHPSPIKDKILQIEINETFSKDYNKMKELNYIIKDLANLSYKFSRIKDIDSLSIEEGSHNGLALTKFGINI